MASGGGSGTGTGKKSVLFVCLGNICRSPMAEGVFRDIVQKQGIGEEWDIDSAATSNYHTGDSPDSRCLSTLRKRGIMSYQHVVRQIKNSDFNRFSYIFGMDNANMESLQRIKPDSFNGKLELLGSYDDKNKTKQIRDPYYDSGNQGFEECYDHSRAACIGFLIKEGFVTEDQLKV